MRRCERSDRPAFPPDPPTLTVLFMTSPTSDVLRTPAERFAALPDYPFEGRFVELANPDGGSLQMHAVDEGPRDAPVVLMLHGEPMWSYLYRKMIPVFVDAGLRAVAPDQIGFGKSDKPARKTSYTFQRHIDWMVEFVRALDLRDITFFGQDWGGPVGLGVLAAEPDRFSRAVAANTMLHTCEAELAGRLFWSNHALPGGDVCVSEALLGWILASQREASFHASTSAEFATARDIAKEHLDAYDAPFPDERFAQGMRQFPALIPVTPGDVGATINLRTWEALRKFDRPFLTLFGDSDPGTRGWDAIFQERVPGAKGQPHETIERAGHFLQEDCGREVADKVVDWIRATPL